jgi:hypothetical protein
MREKNKLDFFFLKKKKKKPTQFGEIYSKDLNPIPYTKLAIKLLKIKLQNRQTNTYK